MLQPQPGTLVRLTNDACRSNASTVWLNSRRSLTIRQAIAPLIRRTWGTAQTLLGLESHAEWWRAYYHFIRPDESLRVALAQPIERKGRQMPKRYRSRTPAMAAGITRHRWSVTEFLRFPLPEASL